MLSSSNSSLNELTAIVSIGRHSTICVRDCAPSAAYTILSDVIAVLSTVRVNTTSQPFSLSASAFATVVAETVTSPDTGEDNEMSPFRFLPFTFIVFVYVKPLYTFPKSTDISVIVISGVSTASALAGVNISFHVDATRTSSITATGVFATDDEPCRNSMPRTSASDSEHSSSATTEAAGSASPFAGFTHSEMRSLSAPSMISYFTTTRYVVPIAHSLSAHATDVFTLPRFATLRLTPNLKPSPEACANKPAPSDPASVSPNFVASSELAPVSAINAAVREPDGNSLTLTNAE